MLSFRAGVVCPGIFQFSGFILRDGASRLLGMRPSRRALLTMVRSAAAPRVSNHAAMDGRLGSSGMTLGELPLRHGDGSIDRRGLAGVCVIPGLVAKCADARSRVAETS